MSKHVMLCFHDASDDFGRVRWSSKHASIVLQQHMHNRNFEVYISSDDRRLPEYKEQLHDEKTSSCYIPSEAGKVSDIADPALQCGHS